jgi:hypothetical protein
MITVNRIAVAKVTEKDVNRSGFNKISRTTLPSSTFILASPSIEGFLALGFY